ncbi:MAG TPA: PIG-L family deacetylase [Anaerolineales bacterium]|nr:PIG-L family deacetylase [Anaerolineales bacterium]
MSNSTYIPESVMLIVAHPDDPEFSCAGTMARWAQAGAKICYVICTSGDVGIADPGITRQEAAKIREAEQREACRITGVDEVIFLGEPDGLLMPTLELRYKLVREIRRFRPEVVVTGDPTRLLVGDHYINHPDHRAASLAALDAVFPAAGQPNLFEDIAKEGFGAHKTRKVYIITWEPSEANEFVNIESTIDIKVEALRAHKSQMKGWDPEPRIREWAALRSKGKEMPYAEAFRVITLVNDADWEQNKGCVIDCDSEDVSN